MFKYHANKYVFSKELKKELQKLEFHDADTDADILART